LAFQAHYMHALPLEEKVERVLPFLERAGLVRPPIDAATRDKVTRVVEALADRLKVFGDVVIQGAFFFGEEVPFDDKAFAKRLLAPGAADRLADYRGWLAGREAFDAPSLERDTHGYLGERGLALGDIVHAVRVAVTGTAAGPGLFDCLAVVGKETSLRRIDRALLKAEGQ
jgi:glutamyl-tRNA synthetase